MRRTIERTALVAVMIWAAPGRAADHDAIQAAVERGVQYLKSIQKEDGTWPHQHIGATALAMLTLLECDTPANDPAVQKASEAVRQQAVSLDHTYSLALTLLLLDRLGDDKDIALIEALTVRLLAGQNQAGGWSYTCPRPDDKEIRRLSAHLRQRTQLVGAAELPKIKAEPKAQRMLSKETQQQLQQLKRRGPRQGGDDNSNTQFALLALWIGRRHGLPVDEALARVEQRFRRSQHGDGGWGYTSLSIGEVSTMSMTCAGLLGLAVGHASRVSLRAELPGDGKPRQAGRDPGRDPAVRAGLLALGSVVGQARGNLQGRLPALTPAVDYYFLWSLERVAVAYGLQTIGKKDWYAWGAELLLASQDQEGGWHGGWSEGGVNTCFALLFLRRANLALDLSNSLKGQVKDPGEVTLKQGGVGGADLKKPELQPGRNPHVQVAARSEPESARLSDELVKTAVKQQPAMIEKFGKSPGLVYTQALAAAIPKLDGPAKALARDALAERLTRMKADTLRDKLRDDDAEIRSAAALACAMKDERSHIPELIPMLEDPMPRVGKAAHLALKTLSGQDLGVDVAGWRSWWNGQGKR